MLVAVREQRPEGVIGKRKDSLYEPEKRGAVLIQVSGESRSEIGDRRLHPRTARVLFNHRWLLQGK